MDGEEDFKGMWIIQACNEMEITTNYSYKCYLREYSSVYVFEPHMDRVIHKPSLLTLFFVYPTASFTHNSRN